MLGNLFSVTPFSNKAYN